MTTRDAIIDNTISLLSRFGYEGTSMRDVANAAGTQTSVIYHYFSNKESLFRESRHRINHILTDGISTIEAKSAPELFRKQLEYQFEQRALVVAVLKYFMAVADEFPLIGGSYIPERAYVHTIQLVQQGVKEGVYKSVHPTQDARMITHLVDGFLLEYSDRHLKKSEIHQLVNCIADFAEAALSPRNTSTDRLQAHRD